MSDWYVVSVAGDNTAAFAAYCRAYGAEHDESNLPQDDFVPTAEYPAYLLMRRYSPGEMSGAEATVGAACLIRGPGYVRERIARFMILHAVQPLREAYSALLSALAPHVADLDYAYGFIPEELTAVRQIWEKLGLRVERYAYVLEHPGETTLSVEMPSGYRFQQVHESDQQALAAFCELLNISFAGQPQHADAAPADLMRDIAGPYGLPDGLMLLWSEGRPVGTVRVERDNGEQGAASIDCVAVHPAYRGRGLGHLLIRQALGVARDQSLHPVYLGVSASNETAIQLYASEGFRKKRVMVCYRWRP